ncbi:uncharacterized protein LOC126050215 [Accipiter gentilis]|uniref:uncharacterized protein LOC126050215 n=1 Tax=Astur gentilis TaxID=8957 RepID=UPI00210F74F7|nr:uncharacterized protein LOC126050215 [Accipiter gentilis]
MPSKLPCARWHLGWCWKGVHSYGRERGSRAPCPPCREQKQAVTQHSLLGCRNGNRTGCAGPVLPAWASQLWLSQCFLCLFGLLDNFESRSWKGWRLNSLFFPTSTCCCLKPQRLTGPSGKMLKPQPSCARSEMPCRVSLCPLVLIPQHATEFPSSLSALAALHGALLSSSSTLLAAREGTRAVGLLLCRGLSLHPRPGTTVRGCCHLLAMLRAQRRAQGCCPGTPTGRAAGLPLGYSLHPASPAAQGKEQGLNTAGQPGSTSSPCTALICPTCSCRELGQRTTEDSKAVASRVLGSMPARLCPRAAMGTGFGLPLDSPCLSQGGAASFSQARRDCWGCGAQVSCARGPGGSAEHLSLKRVSLPSTAWCCASVSQPPGGEGMRHVEVSATMGK